MSAATPETPEELAVGGNQRIPDALADALKDRILLDHRLESLDRTSSGYKLAFQTRGGSKEVFADVVVCTVRFSVLRKIDVRIPLPASKRRAIQELGYGTSAKLFFGFEKPLWRELGYGGNLFTDTDCQLVWDSSRLPGTAAGALTMLLGGKAGVAVGNGSIEGHEARLIPEIEKAWPGVAGLRTGTARRFHWPSHPHTLGCYASYRVGQWESIRGEEFRPVGQLYFAGEHCSLEAQGYMEGGAETARRVAAAIARKAGRTIA